MAAASGFQIAAAPGGAGGNQGLGVFQRLGVGCGAAQLVEILAGGFAIVLTVGDRHQTAQRFDMAGSGVEHALPGFPGTRELLAVLPVAAALDQHAERAGIGLVAG